MAEPAARAIDKKSDCHMFRPYSIFTAKREPLPSGLEIRTLRDLKMLRQFLLVVGAASLAACSNNAGSTYPFAPSHVGTLLVTARTSTGMPLDSVEVSAVPLSDLPGSFDRILGITNAQGRSQMLVERFNAAMRTSGIDTVRFAVTAQVFKRAYLAGNNGQRVILRDTLQLRLVPYGQAPLVDSLAFVFGPP